MSDSADMRQLAALALTCGKIEETGRDIAVEQFLSRLVEDFPNVAKVIAPVLQARGDPKGKRLGHAIEGLIGEYQGEPFMQVPVALSVDYLILTVKKVELTACLRVFDVSATDILDLGRGLEVWTSATGGRTFAIAMIGTDGNVESAIRLGGLLTLIRAKAAILIGMAGGVPAKVDIGDVVVAESVIAYEFQQMTPKGPIYRPKSYSPPERHISRTEILDLVVPNWAAQVRDDLLNEAGADELPKPDSSKDVRSWTPKVRRGIVLAGSKLIEDGSLPQLGRDVHGRTLAAEMEGAGFAAACTEQDVPWLVVRGIADHGQNPRPKDWQFAASYAAARFVRDGIDHKRIDLLH